MEYQSLQQFIKKSAFWMAISPKWGIDKEGSGGRNFVKLIVGKFKRKMKMAFFDLQSPSAADVKVTAIRTGSGHPASALLRNIPRFKYEPPKVGRSTHGAIAVDRYIFHQIADMNAFYLAMGYDKNARDNGLDGEEFIWERYMRDGANFSNQCLQLQIAVYLRKYSAKFKVLYGQTYAAMLGKCALIDMDGRDQHCVNCPMHRRVAV